MLKLEYMGPRRCGLFAGLMWIAAGCAIGSAIGWASGCSSEGAPEQSPADSVQLPVAPVETAQAFDLYRNARFDYVVAYPDSLLIPLGESQNGDGQRFVASDSSVVLTAFGQNLFSEDSIASVFDRRIRSRRDEDGIILHAAQADSSFVIRGTTGERIYYEKSVFYEDRMATIELTYPIGMQEVLDTVVTLVSDSFGRRIP